MFTLAELRLLIEGLETLMLEYGESPERVALRERLRAELARLRAELESLR
jgi:hypothetical protein